MPIKKEFEIARALAFIVATQWFWHNPIDPSSLTSHAMAAHHLTYTLL
jgi:hypothetical protein